MTLEGCRIYELLWEGSLKYSFGGEVCSVWELIRGVLDIKDLTLDTIYDLEGVI